MSSRKGKVAGDKESNRDEKSGKKQRKTREDRVLYTLKRGKKTESPTEKRKGGKKQRKNREERVLYALKRGKKERVQQRK